MLTVQLRVEHSLLAQITTDPSRCAMVKHPVRSLAPLPYMVMSRNYLQEITGNFYNFSKIL